MQADKNFPFLSIWQKLGACSQRGGEGVGDGISHKKCSSPPRKLKLYTGLIHFSISRPHEKVSCFLASYVTPFRTLYGTLSGYRQNLGSRKIPSKFRFPESYRYIGWLVYIHWQHQGFKFLLHNIEVMEPLDNLVKMQRYIQYLFRYDIQLTFGTILLYRGIS